MPPSQFSIRRSPSTLSSVAIFIVESLSRIAASLASLAHVIKCCTSSSEGNSVPFCELFVASYRFCDSLNKSLFTRLPTGVSQTRTAWCASGSLTRTSSASVVFGGFGLPRILTSKLKSTRNVFLSSRLTQFSPVNLVEIQLLIAVSQLFQDPAFVCATATIAPPPLAGTASVWSAFAHIAATDNATHIMTDWTFQSNVPNLPWVLAMTASWPFISCSTHPLGHHCNWKNTQKWVFRDVSERRVFIDVGITNREKQGYCILYPHSVKHFRTFSRGFMISFSRMFLPWHLYWVVFGLFSRILVYR